MTNSTTSQSLSSPVEKILHLQRTVGNQSVQKMFETGAIQAKLTIGAPDDEYEREADRVADQVMRMPDADVALRVESRTVQPMRIQRMCSECNEELAQRKPEEEEEELLQAKEMPGQTPEVSPGIESRINNLKGGGQPLDSATRSFLEPRFGHDFSDVRVHTDSSAADTAKSIHARAFTLGNHIALRSCEYRPESQAYLKLLAHELTHVVQQGERRSNNNAVQGSFVADSRSGLQIQRSLVEKPRLIVKTDLMSDTTKGILEFIDEFFEEGVSSTAVLGSMVKAAIREGFEEVHSLIRDSELPIPKKELMVALDGLKFVFDTVVDVYVFELTLAMGVAEGLLEMIGGLLHLISMIFDLLSAIIQELLCIEGNQEEVANRWREFIDGLLNLKAAIKAWHEQWLKDFRAASPSEKSAMAGRLVGQVLAIVAATLATSGIGAAGAGGRLSTASRLARVVTPEGLTTTVVVEEAVIAAGAGTKAGAVAAMGPPTAYMAAKTPKASSAKGARVPSDDAGKWSGKRGEGVFTPNGTNWSIPFRKARPNFNEFVEKGHTFRNVKGLTGIGDEGIMLDKVIEKFGKANSFSTHKGAKAWLKNYTCKKDYGTGLHMHHSGVNSFQLVPKRVHDAVQHGGFPGSASSIRGS